MKNKMITFLLYVVLMGALVSGCAATVEKPDAARHVTDMAGRIVSLPVVVDKAFGTDPVGTITLYTLAPEKMIGWNYALNDTERANIMLDYADLPILGMKDTLNAEAVIQAAPDVIIQMGATNESAAQQADQLQQKLNIPVVVLSGKLTDIPAAYTALGDITGDVARAQALADYSQTVLDRAQRVDIPAGERVTVYYGNGIDSLETAPSGSDAAEVIEFAGGVNVADLQTENPNERASVGKEQIIAWNPDIMFVNGEPKKDVSGGGAADAILNDPDYATIKAVTNGKVYGIPKSPFSWLDRPKAPNRVIGVVWAGVTMYSELYAETDLTQEIQYFYDLFYHIQLDNAQVEALLAS